MLLLKFWTTVKVLVPVIDCAPLKTTAVFVIPAAGIPVIDAPDITGALENVLIPPIVEFPELGTKDVLFIALELIEASGKLNKPKTLVVLVVELKLIFVNLNLLFNTIGTKSI